jgi:hypothetical protein
MSASYAHTARRSNRMNKIAAGACAIAVSASAATLVFTLHHDGHHAAAPAAATHSVTPTHHVAPINFVTPSHPVAPANFVTPSHPVAPTNLVTPSHPASPSQT